ncbi:MAG: PilN domain-containing protein [Microgenomates group bacterium]
MTAQTSTIEFLPQEDWEKGVIGKILKWIITIGRHIVIFTELIVILAFLSRFKLDRDLTDLGEKIKQQQAIINSWSSFEKEFRFLQTRLEKIEKIEKEQIVVGEILAEISQKIPTEVSLSSLEVSKDGKITFTASSLTERGVGLFLTNLKKSNLFKEVSLTSISLNQEKGSEIKFQIECLLNKK